MLSTQNDIYLKERGLSLQGVHTFLKKHGLSPCECHTFLMKRGLSPRECNTIFKLASAKPSCWPQISVGLAFKIYFILFV